MDKHALTYMSTFLTALADPTRLQIVQLIGREETSVNTLVDSLGCSQPKISRHLAYLRSAGVVSTRREGKWVFYKLDQLKLAEASAVLNALVGGPATRHVDPNAKPVHEMAADIAEPVQAQERPSHNEIETYLL
jgi:DNA-binding transcriptional ArsR family regulator